MLLKEMEPLTQITPHFKFYELSKSETATRLGIDNSIPDQQTLDNAVALCENVLQPIRNRFGAYSPGSIYRSQDLERALKGKPDDWESKSQHTKGQAADIEVWTTSNYNLAAFIQSRLDFDQLILECYDPKGGPNSGWVHVSWNGEKNRKEVLSYVKNKKNEWHYVKGLVTL